MTLLYSVSDNLSNRTRSSESTVALETRGDIHFSACSPSQANAMWVDFLHVAHVRRPVARSSSPLLDGSCRDNVTTCIMTRALRYVRSLRGAGEWECRVLPLDCEYTMCLWRGNILGYAIISQRKSSNCNLIWENELVLVEILSKKFMYCI